jgi:hypothetical protein
MTSQLGRSIPIATASMVGGVCVMLLVANLVARQGLVNGIVLMTSLDFVASVSAPSASIRYEAPSSLLAHASTS